MRRRPDSFATSTTELVTASLFVVRHSNMPLKRGQFCKKQPSETCNHFWCLPGKCWARYRNTWRRRPLGNPEARRNALFLFVSVCQISLSSTQTLTLAGQSVVGEVGREDVDIGGDTQVVAGRLSGIILFKLEGVMKVIGVAALRVRSVEVANDTWCSAGIERRSTGRDCCCEDGGDGGKLHIEVVVDL
jgi:hypothetical protein